MIDILPEEILAAAFELGILTMGLRFLPPVCLVCRNWYNIVRSTPRLWGIIDIYRRANPLHIRDQLLRCKAAPLTVFFDSSSEIRTRAYKEIVNTLLDMSENWESAVVPSDAFERRTWPDMYPNLEDLVLTSGSRSNGAFRKPDQGDTPSKKLREVVLERLHFSYTEPFLSPYLTSFTYIGRSGMLQLAETIDSLSQLPNLRFLKIHQVDFKPQLLSTIRIASLPHLETLDIAHHNYPSLLLSHIAAPNLKTLSIDHSTENRGRANIHWWPPGQSHLAIPDDPAKTLIPFLSQWCDSKFLPAKLHTLNLLHSIAPEDIPILASFLQRIPALVRLSIVGLKPHPNLGWYGGDDELEDEAAVRQLARIIGSPLNTGGDTDEWLLPSLMILQLELQSLHTQDLIDIAQKRGIYSKATMTQGPPKRLRTLLGFICSGGNEDEVKHLRRLVETMHCTCMGCSMNLMNVED